jgi:hypothetical protein
VLSSALMDSHLIRLDSSGVRVVHLRNPSLAGDLPFARTVARLQERRADPVFVTACFIGLLATLGILGSDASNPTARCSARADRAVRLQQPSRVQRIAFRER